MASDLEVAVRKEVQYQVMLAFTDIAHWIAESDFREAEISADWLRAFLKENANKYPTVKAV